MTEQEKLKSQIEVLEMQVRVLELQNLIQMKIKAQTPVNNLNQLTSISTPYQYGSRDFSVMASPIASSSTSAHG